MNELLHSLHRNRIRLIALAIFVTLLLLALQGLSLRDWSITVMRGLAVGAVTFLAAAGLSLIFGLMDVLNLAHGTLFMIGAYVGWTAYVRPDTAVDVATPVLLIAAGFLTRPVFDAWLNRRRIGEPLARLWPWVALVAGVALIAFTLRQYPVSIWNPNIYEQSPIVFAIALEQNALTPPPHAEFTTLPAALGLAALVAGGLLLALSMAGFARARGEAASTNLRLNAIFLPGALLIAGLALYAVNAPLTAALFAMPTTGRFLIAIVTATLTGAALGALMESTLIRPLYARPIYQLMLTLGLGVIGREIVIAVWGRTGITMPKPALFSAVGAGCPASGLAEWLASGCSTITFMGGRLRTYNELFVITVGALVLIAVWLLLQRTRLGMIIRAGVQDRQMVEALGINVRRTFTFVFALGVGLASLGGVLAGPAFGLSDAMGEALLLSALIALAIGGLTSFPGAAAGAVLVGLLEQFLIRYGQTGIPLPFLAEPFKPSPPLVPASTVLLMVLILLALPQGLFGRKE
jgi:branched-chain amino acid transport system permease protein